MLAVVPRRERSARGMEILSSAWTEGTRDILHHHLRRSEPPDPPPAQPGAHLAALEGLDHAVQARDVVLVHSGHEAGALQAGSVTHQQLLEARAGSAPSIAPSPCPPEPLTHILVIVDDRGRLPVAAVQVERGRILLPGLSSPQSAPEHLEGGEGRAQGAAAASRGPRGVGTGGAHSRCADQRSASSAAPRRRRQRAAAPREP